MPGIALGVIQFGDDQNVTPVVCLDCPDEPSAERLARLLIELQNGDRTMRPDDLTFSVGDVAIKVSVDPHPERPKEAVLASVSVRLKPGHLTEAVYACSTVESDSATVFRMMQQAMRHFILTVSVAGQPRCELLYLMKYNMVWRSPLGAV